MGEVSTLEKNSSKVGKNPETFYKINELFSNQGAQIYYKLVELC